MIITDVILPTTIVDQMAAKTMVISQNAAQKMNQEFEMLTLKQNEEVRRRAILRNRAQFLTRLLLRRRPAHRP